MTKYSYTLFIFLLLLSITTIKAESPAALSNDPHISRLGFFDVHICNWPKRTSFFKILFSSEKYNKIDSMKVFSPNGKLLVELDKNKYKILTRKNKPEKRVFIIDIDVPDKASTGWYKINVLTKDGRQYSAKDYVIMSKLGRAAAMQPASERKKYALPITLKWNPVPGAQFYKAFVRDEWTGDLIYESKLIGTNKINIPKGLLESGGNYTWRVHSRDTNEHILLGDFNTGSVSKKEFFEITR